MSPLVASEPASPDGGSENGETEAAQAAAVDGEEEFAVDVIATGDGERGEQPRAGDSAEEAGTEEEEREVMVLVALRQLSSEELAEVDRHVLEQEDRAYELFVVYGRTEPIEPAPM